MEGTRIDKPLNPVQGCIHFAKQKTEGGREGRRRKNKARPGGGFRSPRRETGPRTLLP